VLTAVATGRCFVDRAASHHGDGVPGIAIGRMQPVATEIERRTDAGWASRRAVTAHPRSGSHQPTADGGALKTLGRVEDRRSPSTGKRKSPRRPWGLGGSIGRGRGIAAPFTVYNGGPWRRRARNGALRYLVARRPRGVQRRGASGAWVYVSFRQLRTFTPHSPSRVVDVA
jgi:hypothetical protein